MYIPAAFAEHNFVRMHAFMQRYSFATLVSETGSGPAISHVPLLLDPDRGERGTIVGHFARANDHWRTAEGRPTTAIYHGPHAYISPRWYAEPNVVPTWNYAAVHAAGVLRVIDDRDWLLALVTRSVNLYEAAQPQPWRLESQDPAFIDRLLGAIVGFELSIESLEGKWKLSQNHSAERRQRVIQNLSACTAENELAIAALMAAGLQD